MLGSDIDASADPALGVLVERTTLFARVSPQQKLRIILALKARGHVVGYIGDGINDAPSLHAADVGISVSGATDVAKDAADIILLDRGLGVLHTGIIEGRKAFGNVMKYLLMGTSSNFGNMFSMAVASLLVPFLPMLPTQILLNNFLYDFSQLAIPSDRVDDAYIRKPHHWDMGVLRQFMIRIGLVSSAFDLLTFAVLLWLFRSTPPVFRTGWFIESIVTQTLVLLVIRTIGQSVPPSAKRPAGGDGRRCRARRRAGCPTRRSGSARVRRAAAGISRVRRRRDGDVPGGRRHREATTRSPAIGVVAVSELLGGFPTSIRMSPDNWIALHDALSSEGMSPNLVDRCSTCGRPISPHVCPSCLPRARASGTRCAGRRAETSLVTHVRGRLTRTTGDRRRRGLTSRPTLPEAASRRRAAANRRKYGDHRSGFRHRGRCDRHGVDLPTPRGPRLPT